MRINILHNFISPVTGRILATTDYILVGDGQGIATPSPALIDLRLDLINLRKDYETVREADFVIGFPNIQLPNAQVLSELADGIMSNTGGIVSTTDPIDLGFAPANATYIIQTLNLQLLNAQVMEFLGTGITKLIDNGVFAIAVPDVDYVTLDTLNALVDQAAQSAANAAQSATDAISAAIVASNAATAAAESAATAAANVALATNAAEAAVAAAAAAEAASLAAQASVAAAGSYATDAQNALNQLLAIALNDLPVTGDIDMQGYRIKNLHQSPEGDFDAISMTFLWDLIHGRVEILWP